MGEITFSRVKGEIKQQLWLALPMMGVNLLQTAVQLVSVMFVGHLGELELSSTSIATSVANVTGFSLLMGLGVALETLCGQAYGAKHYHMLGVYMQRAMLVLTIVAIPIAVLWLNMEPVLLLLGQQPDISRKAGHYARFLVPGLFAYAFLQPLNKFLQTQSAVLPMFLSSCFTLLVHTLSCWILVYKLGFGNSGAAISSSIINWLNVILLVMVVAFTPRCRQCWDGFSREALGGTKEFLRLAIPSAVMICLEWWCWEVLILLSGVLPNPELEASMFSILFNTWPMLAMFPIGIGAAASVRISNELGAGRPDQAKFSFVISMCFSALGAAMLSLTLFLVRNVLGKAFTNEEEVIRYVARMLTLLIVYPAISGFQGTAAGAVRGCGRQAVAAAVDLAAYYVVGLPLAYFLAFPLGWRGEGLLVGLLGGDCLQAVIFVAMAVTTNWQREAQKATERFEQVLPLQVPLLQ